LPFFLSVMNSLEIFIIYLSCGAPFGVYFFLQNRNRMKPFEAYLKSFLTVIVWIPYAFRLLNTNITKKLTAVDFDKSADSDSRLKERIDEVQKRLARIFTQADASFPIFEFREVTERYAALTLAGQIDDAGGDESELLRIANHQNIELGAKCITRRNRMRLELHQNLARKDFLKMLAKFAPFETEKLRAVALEFVTLLNDGETLQAVENLFAEVSQTDHGFAVRQREKVVWKAREHKPSPAKTISAPLTQQRRAALSATIKSCSKD
jgi:hypothetical protein